LRKSESSGPLQRYARWDSPWRFRVRRRFAPKRDPVLFASTPHDPSRSCVDLQSFKLRTVAARLASRLRLRPLGMTLTSSRPQSPRPFDRSGWLLSWPFTLPQGPTGRPRPARLAANAHRKTPGRPLMRFLAPSTLPTWRIHFPESAPQTTAAGAVALPSEPTARGRLVRVRDAVDQPGPSLPDSRRVGCRRWRPELASGHPSVDERFVLEHGRATVGLAPRIGSVASTGGHPTRDRPKPNPSSNAGPFPLSTRRSSAVGTAVGARFRDPKIPSTRASGRRLPQAVSRRTRSADSVTPRDRNVLSMSGRLVAGHPRIVSPSTSEGVRIPQASGRGGTGRSRRARCSTSEALRTP
jgi:hypothetical protein